MFSLKTMLLAVVVAAIIAAACVYRTPAWAGVVVAMALGLLIYGLSAIYLAPSKRSFFVPACIAGAVYGLAAFCQLLGFQEGLPTNRLLFELWYTEDVQSQLKNQGNPIEFKDSAYTFLSNDFFMLPLVYEGPAVTNTFRVLQQIGHAAFAIGVAVIAGLVGSYVTRRRELEARSYV